MVLIRTGQPYDVFASPVGLLLWIADSMLPTVVLQKKSAWSSLFPGNGGIISIEIFHNGLRSTGAHNGSVVGEQTELGLTVPGAGYVVNEDVE
ncbi:hypothetical protein AVEN_231134-1 [Araneus ventricosus]|uniref:Uncharacterized protein n=1 Tax=Araneus ventricosus TaxID=182803 RepID=A0A4Y2KXG7_ARAVE|nr:hypothetical protein AVEN_231134-1 [Araneus ventricosus]